MSRIFRTPITQIPFFPRTAHAGPGGIAHTGADQTGRTGWFSPYGQDVAPKDKEGVFQHLPLDMLPALIKGGFQVVRSDGTGERYLFPVAKPRLVRATGSAAAVQREKNAGWKDAVIPPALLGPDASWVRTDGFLLHLKNLAAADDAYNHVGKFSWHPQTHEFLPSRLQTHHVLTIRRFGSRPFNEYVRGIYCREERVLMLRAYFNPLGPDGAFNPYGEYDAEADRMMAERTLAMLAANGMPSDLTVIAQITSNETIRLYNPLFV